MRNSPFPSPDYIQSENQAPGTESVYQVAAPMLCKYASVLVPRGLLAHAWPRASLPQPHLAKLPPQRKLWLSPLPQVYSHHHHVPATTARPARLSSSAMSWLCGHSCPAPTLRAEHPLPSAPQQLCLKQMSLLIDSSGLRILR